MTTISGRALWWTARTILPRVWASHPCAPFSQNTISQQYLDDIGEYR